jgi:methylmalonyl-CoA/ethylmalonyl-CoA epimerase
MLPHFRTHHIGVLVADVARARESYLECPGYSIRSECFHDPLQTAFVQFLALPGDSVLLELVAPDGPQSRLSNALKKSGGINHICYSVPDIADAASALQKCGCVVIHSPQPAVAFNGRSIAWLMNRDHLLVELVERGGDGEL